VPNEGGPGLACKRKDRTWGTLRGHLLFVAQGLDQICMQFPRIPNGINTVYQLGTPGVLPTTANAPSGGLVNEPYTILPGFPPPMPARTARVVTILLGFGSRMPLLYTSAMRAT
jgi:hypothetical protein